MAFYVVGFEHPDAQGWQAQLGAHLSWLRLRVADGSVRASGPCVGAADRAAKLIMVAPDRPALDRIVATDPFAVHGLIANMTVEEWDPIFGAWAAESTMPTIGAG
ncbi:YciI family protein [Sphingomonas sp.]|uniref:YciI family protein n=1 Tax=Sphingomonas sp. TaxID=28214 RepID=UPI003CC52E24